MSLSLPAWSSIRGRERGKKLEVIRILEGEEEEEETTSLLAAAEERMASSTTERYEDDSAPRKVYSEQQLVVEIPETAHQISHGLSLSLYFRFFFFFFELLSIFV